MVTLRLRPVDRWPREQTKVRQASPFLRPSVQDPVTKQWSRQQEVAYSVTLDELDRELRMLNAREAVLQLALGENDIRVDGEMKANARLRHPGVILTFTVPRKGVLTFACDRFERWQTNVRAIAKGLEALRLVDRYGITESGEQYVGWQELPSGAPMGERRPAPEMSLQQAARAVVGFISGPHDLEQNARTAVEDEDYRRYAYRQALKQVHPDVGAEETDGFLLLQAAMKILEANDAG